MDFNTPIILPSLLAADFANVENEVRRAEDAGAKMLHLDVMDGNFVDNISFGPAMVEAVRRHTDMFLDVHLMIQRPDHYLDRFIAAGANNISVHVEAQYVSSLDQTLARIKNAGLSAGLVINPSTPFESAIPFLSQIDILLVMTVVPGFGGQPFMENETMPKLAAARDYRNEHHLHYHLQVDGGIYPNTIPIARRNGANLFVCGTSSYGKPGTDHDMKAAMQDLIAAAQ